MNWTHVIMPSNPTNRKDREEALALALWAAFRHFLNKADRFSVYYHPGDPTVEPLLAMGFTPQTPELRIAAQELTGELTAGLRLLLLANGKGRFPWYAVTLYIGQDPVYTIIEHETMAMLSADPTGVEALIEAGVERDLVRRWRQGAEQPDDLQVLTKAIARTLRPNDPKPSARVHASAEAGRSVLQLLFDGEKSAFWVDYVPAELDGVTAEKLEQVLAQLSPPVRLGEALRLIVGEDDRLELLRLPPRPGIRVRGFQTHALYDPTRAEWLAALRIAARQADRFAVCWRDEPPAANGWDSRYGLDRVRPFCPLQGSSDLVPMAWEMEGPLTLEVAEILLTLPPTGIPDLVHLTPRLSVETAGPAPWWWLLLLKGQEVVFESHDNGARINISLLDDDATELAAQAPGLRDLADTQRMAVAFAKMKGFLRHRARDLIFERDGAERTGVREDGSHSWELQKGGTVIISLSVDSATLRRLALIQNPERLLTDLPQEARHVVVEQVDGELRWRVRAACADNTGATGVI